MTDWTLVSRRKGAHFYRPVGNVPTGLDWDEARELAHTMPYSSDVYVWNVPRVSSHEEDRDSILEDNGKRFPIRWDAAPQIHA
jgi:hypothetical protein